MTAKILSKALPALMAILIFSAVNAGAFPQAGQDSGAGAAGAAGGGMNAVTGKVVETMDSGGYTYVLLEKDGKKTWAACPVMKVTVGQEVALRPGMVMPNFHSKTLNRSFDNIVFSSGPAK